MDIKQTGAEMQTNTTSNMLRERKAGQLTGIGVIRTSFDAARQPGPSRVKVGNAPLPPEAKFAFPSPGLTLFYGKAGKEGMDAYNRTLSQFGEVGVPIEVTVDCGKIFPSDLRIVDLPQTGLIRSDRMSPEVETVLVAHWRKRLLDEGGSERELSLMNWHNQSYIAERPDIIASLRDSREFAHIKAISWLAPWGSTKCGFLTVQDPSAVVNVVAGWRWGESTKVAEIITGVRWTESNIVTVRFS